ncbi:tripartite tricarboxylate transporter substrate-binding protein [Falsiroseomonas sp. HW251]|uniref:tripartite tricarboxylate transporter substrate-binding protein n=1 Tax=Falsiroseomonas sp. HW251 TaxID=3390998 RepID=UPI003D3123FF
MSLARRALPGLAAGLLLPAVARADRRVAVELLIAAPVGSLADRWARGMAPFLERAWPRVALLVRNRPGRGGLEALNELALAGPERKMIAALTTPVLLARAIESDEASPLTRLSPLAALVEEPAVLVAVPGGATDLDSLRNGTRTAPIGTPPPGTGAHVTAMRLAERVGLPLLAFPSAAAARQAAAAGHVTAAVLTLPDTAAAIRDGRLVALGVASSQRSPLLPDAPTLREAGIELLGATRRGFALGPDAPAEWRARLAGGLQTLAADPDLASFCAENGQVPRFLGPEAWTSLLQRQEEELRRRWRDDPWLSRRA